MSSFLPQSARDPSSAEGPSREAALQAIHPFLALPTAPIVYDVRYPPSTLSFPPSSPYLQHDELDLRVPLADSLPRIVRIISKEFPWPITIDFTMRNPSHVITCLEVLSIVYGELQKPLLPQEWALADGDRREAMVEARQRRQREGWICPVMRIDWLGNRTLFQGLHKDAKFSSVNLMPGTNQVNDTYVMKLKRRSH